jgi:hypothetical protein
MSALDLINFVQVILTLLVAALFVAMLVVSTVGAEEAEAHDVSTPGFLWGVVLQPTREVLVIFSSKQSVAMVHNDISAHANQGAITHFIVTTADHENVVEIARVLYQVIDVPVNQRVVNVAHVGSHVGEMSKDVVEGSENLRHSFGLSTIFIVFFANGLHAVVEAFGDIHVLDPLNEELCNVRCASDVVDGHLFVEVMVFCALSQNFLQVLAHNALESVAWDGVDVLVVPCQSNG